MLCLLLMSKSEKDIWYTREQPLRLPADSLWSKRSRNSDYSDYDCCYKVLVFCFCYNYTTTIIIPKLDYFDCVESNDNKQQEMNYAA